VPPVCAEAIAGYVCAQACVRQETVHPDGRSVPRLMDAIQAWHIQLAREAKAAAVSGWPKANIPDFEHVETNPDSDQVTRWRIAELCTHKELFTEGREMRHCVSSYARHCRAGKQSVWSLQVSGRKRVCCADGWPEEPCAQPGGCRPYRVRGITFLPTLPAIYRTGADHI